MYINKSFKLSNNMLNSNRGMRFLFTNFYQALRVDENASQQQIKNSFIELAKKHHPDFKEISDDQFIKIKEAYDTLRDPQLRKRYDYELIHGSQQERAKQKYYYYEEQTYTKSQPTFTIASLYGIIGKFGICFMFYYLIKLYLTPMTEHEIRRQNMILSRQNIDSSPSVQEKRRKMYLKEMEEKKISSRVIEIKVTGAGPQTYKAKNSRKNSIQAIPGIKKQPQEEPIYNTDQYI